MDCPANVKMVMFEPGRRFASLHEWAQAAAEQAPPLSDAQCALIRWALAPAIDRLTSQSVTDAAA